MKRKGNMVLVMSLTDPTIFDELEILSQACKNAGLGQLIFIRDFLVDADSARYEFVLESQLAKLWLHDDFDLGVRYISIRGDSTTVCTLEVLANEILSCYTLDTLIRLVEEQASSRPKWLNALALASDSPAEEKVVNAIASFLNSPNEKVMLHAIQAAYLIGPNQFTVELDVLRTQGSSFAKQVLGRIEKCFV